MPALQISRSWIVSPRHHNRPYIPIWNLIQAVYTNSRFTIPFYSQLTHKWRHIRWAWTRPSWVCPLFFQIYQTSHSLGHTHQVWYFSFIKKIYWLHSRVILMAILGFIFLKFLLLDYFNLQTLFRTCNLWMESVVQSIFR